LTSGSRGPSATSTEPPSELRVVKTLCWIVDFRNYLQRRNPPERFPVTAGKFNRLFLEFANTGRTGAGLSKDYLWVRDGSLKACFVSFQVDFDRYASTGNASKYKEQWDRHLERANLLGSEYTQGAFHVSSLWSSTEAKLALISSTATSLAMVFVLAFLTMLLFTGSCCLSLHVVWATLEVISGLLFFMVILMGWPIGPTEVLALIIFVGYALDYSLHVAQKYGSREALDSSLTPTATADSEPLILDSETEVRFRRVKHALKAIGGANLGSAITTSGCSVFLLFCQLTIFKDLGIVVLIVTVLSIVSALVSLPAKLLRIGPLQPSGGCCLNSERLHRSREFIKSPASAARRFLMDGDAPEEATANADGGEELQDKASGSNSSWRRQGFDLKECLEGEEVKELSMGLQAACISRDPILEVARPAHGQNGAQGVMLMDRSLDYPVHFRS